mmetsp:Transcript_18833/g.13655  ORF Transcript_18833/g.13655 Transcript_18833/m.13655 type:complete len:80 (+) Transcript_18833:334-573(+)
MFLFSLTATLIGCFRWIYNNSNYYLLVILNGASFTLFLIVSYFLVIGSTHIFLKGIEVEPSSIQAFPHQQAKIVSEVFG